MKKLLKQAVEQGADEIVICEADNSPLKNIAKKISESNLSFHGFYSCTVADRKTLLVTPAIAKKHGIDAL